MDNNCRAWFENDRRHNRNPMTGAYIDPDGEEWEEIDELCATQVRETFPYNSGRSHEIVELKIPNWDILEKKIKDISVTHWDVGKFPELSKRASYGSTDGTEDLYDYQNVQNDRTILCPETSPREWSELVNHDERKSIMTCMTRFVTDHMFGSILSRMKFLKLISSSFRVMFDSLHTITGDERFDPELVFMVLKGGMSFRMNIMEMIRDLSSNIEGYILNMLRTELRLGDFDFEIVSNHAGLSSSEIVRLNVITYMVTILIRNHIDDNATYFMEFFRFSREHKDDLSTGLCVDIQDACRNLPLDNFFHNITVDHVQVYAGQNTDVNRDSYTPRNPRETIGRVDFAMICDGRVELPTEQRDGICFTKTSSLLNRYGIHTRTIASLVRRSDMFTSHNPIVSYTQNTDATGNIPVIAFQLNRIKYCFTMFFRRRNSDGSTSLLRDDFPGEILDVSHSCIGDTKRASVSVDSMNKLYQQTTIRNIGDVHFMSVTPYGQLNDLEYMLFTQVDSPWDLPKYHMRVRRYVCVFVFYIFSKHGPTNTFRSKIISLYNIISDIRNAKRSTTHPSVMQEFLDRIINVSGGIKAREFREEVLDLMVTFVKLFEYEFRKSRNTKLENYTQDPLSLSRIYRS
jgi:hypothetical protein